MCPLAVEILILTSGQCLTKAKMHNFPILVWRGEGINFASISYKHRRQPGERNRNKMALEPGGIKQRDELSK